MFQGADDEINTIAIRAKAIHSEERRITLQSVQIVAELDSKNAWFHLGISVEQLALYIGLSPSKYYKRLKAAKIMEEYPNARDSFEKGEIQISHIAMIGNRMTPANSHIILEGIKNRSKREIEAFLSRVSPNGMVREGGAIIEKTFRMSEEQAAVLDRVVEVLSSRGRVATSLQGLLRASEAFLDAHDPMRIAERAAEREAVRAACRSKAKAEAKVEAEAEAEAKADEVAEAMIENVVHRFEDEANVDTIIKVEISENAIKFFSESYDREELLEKTPLERIQEQYRKKRQDPRRPIRATVRNRVWLRDEGRCTFLHANGERCKEKMMLEIDHLVMHCRGGSNDESNLALKCRYHNQFSASQNLGRDFMNKKIRNQAKFKH